MVWDYYDGPRTGLTLYRNKAHYFEFLWDHKLNNYSEYFTLTAINENLLKTANRQWAIYREWEFKFHSGQLPFDTHPGHGGIDKEYDKLNSIIETKLAKLDRSTGTYTSVFRPSSKQKDLPSGMMKELEASWIETKKPHFVQFAT